MRASAVESAWACVDQLRSLGSHGRELVDLDAEVRRRVIEEGVTAAQSLGRGEVRGLDDGVTVQVAGAGREPSPATAVRPAMGAPPSSRASPTLPIQAFHACRSCSPPSGVMSAWGVAGPLYKRDELCHVVLLFVVVMGGSSSGRGSTREGYEPFEDVRVGSDRKSTRLNSS